MRLHLVVVGHDGTDEHDDHTDDRKPHARAVLHTQGLLSHVAFDQTGKRGPLLHLLGASGDHEDHEQGVKAGQHECGEPLL